MQTFFNKIEITIQNLKSLSIGASSYGSLLIPVLTSKLPTDLRTLFAQKFTGNVWLLDELSVILKNELEAKERSVSSGHKHFERSKFSRYRSTTSSFHTGSESIKGNCVFCGGNNHNSNRSMKVTDPSARKQVIFQKSLCYICMSLKHKASKCNASHICKRCNGRQHISICQQGNLKSTGENNSGAGNNSTNLQPTLSVTNQHQTQTIPTSSQQNQNNQTLINPAIRLLIFQEILTKTFCFKLSMRNHKFR